LFTATLGYLCLLLALAAALYAIGCLGTGLVRGKDRLLERGRSTVALQTILTTLAAFVLLSALVSGDFSLKYVYDYSASDLSLAYRLSAFWAGNAGSLLLWALLISVLTAVIAHSGQEDDRRLKAAAAVVLLVNVVFFLVSMLLFANPFEVNPQAVADGRGLNPMLRNPWMVIHPVTLYLGYVTAAVPFALAMAALFLRDGSGSWIKKARSWAVLTWVFLSLGNLFGAQWAYVELGWGGYWAWDPVENASFLPWLTCSALLHSLLVQERQGRMRGWNLFLVVLTYWLTLYGTFLVRSGVLASVHAFPKSNLSYWFGFFMFAMLAAAAWLIWSRRRLHPQESQPAAAALSREAAFLYGNILLLAGALIIFIGTNLPIFTRILTAAERTVGQDWFNRTAGPILLAVILMLGICPLLAWKNITPSLLAKRMLPGLVLAGLGTGLLFYFGVQNIGALTGFAIVLFGLLNTLLQLAATLRPVGGDGAVRQSSRRRLGAYLAHLGLVLLTLGVVGDGFYSQEKIVTLQAGETVTLQSLAEYTIAFDGLEMRQEGANTVIYGDLGIEKDGRQLKTMRPEHIYYPSWQSPRNEVAILGGPLEDLYIVLAGWDDQGRQATFQIHVNPLISWLWTGGYLAVCGGLLALWPGAVRKP